jgi:DNA gyrase subunit A
LELARTQERLHLLHAIALGLERYPEVLDVVSTVEGDGVRAALQERFQLDEMQAEVLLDLQFRRVSPRERQRIEDEIIERRNEVQSIRERLGE